MLQLNAHGRRAYTGWRLFQLVFIVSHVSALAWREHSRLVLPHYFARGYRLVDLVRHPNRYVLAKD